MLQTSTLSTSSAVASRAALLAAQGFDESLQRCEDFDLWLRLAFDGGCMAYHADAEVFHRVHDYSLSANSQAMFRDRVRVYEKAASQPSISKDQREIIRHMIAKSRNEGYMDQLKEALNRDNFPAALEAAQQANAVEGNWRLRATIFGLRVSPRTFRALHRVRSFFLARKSPANRASLFGEKPKHG